MNFHQLNNDKHTLSKNKYLILFVFLALIIIVINTANRGDLSGKLRFQAKTLTEIQYFIRNIGAPIKVFISDKTTLIQENDALKKELTTYELYALNNKVLLLENAELRTLRSSIENQTTSTAIISQVVSRIGSFPSGTLLISRDTDNSYSKGAYVLQKQNILLGMVIEVSGNTALVRLVSAPGVETSVIIGGDIQRKTRATVRGTGNGNMIAVIDRSVDIRINDPVTLYGNGRIIVGYVGAIDKKPIDALQKVYIRTPININTIQFVIVKK